MKNSLILLLLAGLVSCKEKVTPVSDQISKIWTAELVKENGTTVFTRGGGGNIKPGYADFRLDLSLAAIVQLKEFEGSAFSGQWALSADNKTLTLSGLVPQPTGSKGLLQYNIVSISDKALDLTLAGASAKTGGTMNTYHLTNP